MAMRQRARQVTTTLLLATALTFTAGCKPPMCSDLMADKPPKTPIVLRDAQEEVKAPERTIKSVPVPQKKEEVKEEPKGKIEETTRGKIITTEWGMKILIKKDGTTEILERPKKKPMPEFIH